MLRGSFWTVTINTVKKVSATGFCINLNLLFLEQIWGPNQKAKCWKFYTFPIITSDKWTQGAGWGRSSWLLLHQSNPKHRGQSGVPGVSGQSQRRGENLVYLMMPQLTPYIFPDLPVSRGPHHVFPVQVPTAHVPSLQVWYLHIPWLISQSTNYKMKLLWGLFSLFHPSATEHWRSWPVSWRREISTIGCDLTNELLLVTWLITMIMTISMEITCI